MLALSYSRISDYRQCPLKFRLKYIDKAPNFQLKDEDKSPALVRGGNIHKSLEQYVLAKLNGQEYEATMPEVRNTIPLVDKIMENYNVRPESQIAINDKFEEVDWFSRDAYFRVIFDLIGFGNDLFLGDYKTGKLTDYSGSMEKLGQLHMNALIGFSLWPEFDECNAIYMYIDHKTSIPMRFQRNETERMKDSLMREHHAINSDINFSPTKNQYCKWCEANKNQCSFALK